VAILLHPARATHDWIPAGVRRGDRMYHVLSDQLGTAGTGELLAFVSPCGLRARWMQYSGTYREHFDAPPRAAECLLRRGARLATNREVGALLRIKRAREAGEAVPLATAPTQGGGARATTVGDDGGDDGPEDGDRGGRPQP
jgi:hypothetical protein